MIVHVFTVCWNEERMLPFFLDHYGAFADRIVVYDNQSTDRTAAIVDAWPGATRMVFDTGGEYVERRLMDIRNQAWKASRGVADWVMVVDVDELLYHPDILGLLARYKASGITLPKVAGFQMVSSTFPAPDARLVTQCRTGFASRPYSKRVCFQPTLDISFGPGSHRFRTATDVVESEHADLKLLHYRYLGVDFLSTVYAARWRRQSAENLKNGFGSHFEPGYAGDYGAVFSSALRKASPVID
jgi:glycosyltransferase involved in cell wall biosynthesis